ncbi:MAG: FkbM family methyltransferase [Caulobacteraceae bacterium]
MIRSLADLGECPRAPSTPPTPHQPRQASLKLTPRQRASWLAHLAKAVTQQHHKNLRDLFQPYIPQKAVVIDVGAHAGQFSKLFARLAVDGAIYAIEPSIYARSILERAVRWNRFANIKIFPVGFSDMPGEATLHTPLTRSGSLGFGRAHFAKTADTTSNISQIVALHTLDDFVKSERIERLDFIKADVEGWEVHVLRGGLETIRQFKPTLYLEVSKEWLAGAGETPEALWQMLKPLGYAASRVDCVAYGMPAVTPAPRYTGAGDYLFIAS